jgi:hypothetical protein
MLPSAQVDIRFQWTSANEFSSQVCVILPGELCYLVRHLKVRCAEIYQIRCLN